jgi:hypothetical protein
MKDMKHQSLRWRFVNQTNPTETVVVHDQGSAQTLATLLQKMTGDWIMQEERPLGAMAPQTAPAPQPPVEKTTEIQLQPAMPAPAPVQAQVPVQAPAPVQAAPAPEAIEVEQHHQEEESAEDHSMAHAMIEAVVNAAQEAQAQDAEDRKASMPPPAPKKADKQDKQEKRERRSAPRFMTEFRVILISGSSSFRTMSADVSLGGMRLKKTIPAAFMKEKCIAYVSHKDLRENIEIVCHVIGDPQDPCRIQFIQPNQTQLKRLNDWLIEHNQGVMPRGSKAS